MFGERPDTFAEVGWHAVGDLLHVHAVERSHTVVVDQPPIRWRVDPIRRTRRAVRGSLPEKSGVRPAREAIGLFRASGLPTRLTWLARPRQKSVTFTAVPSSTVLWSAGISMYPSARDMLVMSPDPLKAGMATPRSSLTVKN